MIRIELYQPAYKEALTEVFKSNQPVYFLDHELPEFLDFLDDSLMMQHYYVIFKDDKAIACGGIAKGDNDVVSMCWGMVHHDLHKQGYGRMLFEYRLQKSHELFPGKPIAIKTTQLTWGFFAKYNFRVTYTEKDFWGPGMDLYSMERP